MIDKFTKEGHWGKKILSDFFKINLKRDPSKIVLIDRDHRLSFEDLEILSNNLALSLKRLGISKNDVVSFSLPNWYQTVIINLALTKLGVIVNPIVPIYKEKEVSFILKQAKSVAMIIPDVFRGFNYVEMLEKIKPDLPHLKHRIVVGEKIARGMISFKELMEGDGISPPYVEIDANEVKLLLYTSGTTAEPKGALHTHNTLICENRNYSGFRNLNESDVIFMPSPITHITGYLYGLELPLIIGCRVVFMDIWNPERALELIAREKCSFTVGATPFLQGLIHSPLIDNYYLGSLTFSCGGAPVPPELIREAWNKANLKAARGYGSTEVPTVSLGGKPGGSLDKAAETDGLVFGNEVQIVDFDNNALPFAREGEIVVKGPEVFVGYKDPSLNGDSFDQEGWFHTGDLGRLSSDGYLEITGRKKDIIIRGGENISAKEIEDLLHMHPGIEVAAAVAMPDAKMGEKVCAYIKLRKGARLTFGTMIDFLLQHNLAKQKLPEHMELLETFPMTPSGKIKKHELRKDIAEKLGLPPVRI